MIAMKVWEWSCFGHIWSTEARDTLASVLFLSRLVEDAKKTVD